MMDRLTLKRPDDWHIHLRDGVALTHVVGHSAAVFGRILAMPNIKPPVTTMAQAQAYYSQIQQAIDPATGCQPLLSLYLTEQTTVDTVWEAKASGFVVAFKYYPMGATTHSEAGVRDLSRCTPVLQALAECGLPLQVHGEVTDPAVDVFDRESAFIERELKPLLHRVPDLRLVFEHITTASAAEFVAHSGERVGATITPQHLLYNRNALFQGGLRPHYYCLPVLKRERHRQALLAVLAEGDRHFFLGTDSAPHGRLTKENACGCAGIYSAHAALPLYAEALESVGALDRLEGFASHFGADYYGLPRHTQTVTLVRRPWTVPSQYSLGEERDLVPLKAGEMLAWQVESATMTMGS